MKGRLLSNVSTKENYGDICSNLACFAHILNISNIVIHKRPLKFKLVPLIPNSNLTESTEKWLTTLM